MPQRLAEALCGEAGVSERRVAELRKAEHVSLLDKLTDYPLDYNGHEGYAKVRGFLRHYPGASGRVYMFCRFGRVPKLCGARG